MGTAVPPPDADGVPPWTAPPPGPPPEAWPGPLAPPRGAAGGGAPEAPRGAGRGRRISQLAEGWSAAWATCVRTTALAATTTCASADPDAGRTALVRPPRSRAMPTSSSPGAEGARPTSGDLPPWLPRPVGAARGASPGAHQGEAPAGIHPCEQRQEPLQRQQHAVPQAVGQSAWLPLRLVPVSLVRGAEAAASVGLQDPQLRTAALHHAGLPQPREGEMPPPQLGRPEGADDARPGGLLGRGSGAVPRAGAAGPAGALLGRGQRRSPEELRLAAGATHSEGDACLEEQVDDLAAPGPSTGARAGHISTAGQLLAGGVAGAVSKTCTAPLARLTILFQVQGMDDAAAVRNSRPSIWVEARRIFREEGVMAFWKGNTVTIVHRLPYSAINFFAYETYKKTLEEFSYDYMYGADSRGDAEGEGLVAPDPESSQGRGPAGGSRSEEAMGGAGRRTEEAHEVLSPAVPASPASPGPVGPGGPVSRRPLEPQAGAAPLGPQPPPGVAPLSSLGQDVLDVVIKLLAGGGAGVTAATLTYPLDLVRTRLAAQRQSQYYKGIVGTLKTIARDEGLLGLYKGMGATLLGVGPNLAINFCVYETVKAKWVQGHPETPTPLVSLGCGSLAGICSSTATFPLDLVRRRMQLEGAGGRGKPVPQLDGQPGGAQGALQAPGAFSLKPRRGIIAMFSHIVRTEGFWALYRGIVPEYWKVVPGVSIAFMTYEFMKRLLVSSSPAP